MSEPTGGRLHEFADAIRSSNASGTFLTFDVMFDHQHSFERLRSWNGISTELIGELYGIRPDDVRIFWYRPALTLKITIPRQILAGEPADTDIDGKQQHAPLLEIVVPELA